MNKMENEKDNYYMQENRRLEKKVKELEENKVYIEKKLKDKEQSEQHDRKQRWKEKNCILIGGYGGISIPLDDIMKKEINDYIFKEVRRIIENEEGMEQQFIDAALKHRRAFINIFTPVVKEIIRDMDFNVKFDTEYEYD